MNMEDKELNNMSEPVQSKIGHYEFLAEPFHCDFSRRLFMGHLGNHLLNAADFHSNSRGFGMNHLNPIHKTWVLSRLAVELEEMPLMYSRFFVDTWVESAMRYFTNRNFHFYDAETGQTYGYGRSVWAMIDTDDRKPYDLLQINNGTILNYITDEKPNPMAPFSRVKMSADAELVRTIDTNYSDVDINGHVNSLKYVEHVLDLWSVDWHSAHPLHRMDIAYVAESHLGDRLKCYREQADEQTFYVRIWKQQPDVEGETEVVRIQLSFR